MNAKRDENRVAVKMAVSYVDGTTLVPIAVNPVTGAVLTDTTHSISFTPNKIAIRDENYQTVLMGVSSTTGEPTPVYADPVTGAILI